MSLLECQLRRGFVVFLLMLMIAPATPAAEMDPPGAYKAPAPDPSPIETLMLEYINRCRANPHEDGLRCSSGASVPADVDLKMFTQEMSAEANVPPLVFDLRLLKAARWHCHYQILNGQGHVEEEGKEGFTGASPTDRVNRAEYQGGIGENAFVGPKDPWYCHVGFVVDWGEGGTGGMQAGRGHRRNILGRDYRLVGVGAVPYEMDKRFACTHNFGSSSQRFVGGVVINDRNKNRFYDLGEGIQGVSLAVGDATLKSWFSGAYTLPVPTEKAKLTVELEGKMYTAILPDGSDNVKFDVFVNERANYQMASTLLAALKKLPPADAKDSRRLIAEIDLCFATQGSLVEDDVFEEIRAITGPVREKVQAEMGEIRQAALEGKVADARPVVRAASLKYARTRAKAWFADAAVCVEIRDGYQTLADLKAEGKSVTPAVVGRVLKKQQGLFQQMTTPEWKKSAMEWGMKTTALNGTPSP